MSLPHRRPQAARSGQSLSSRIFKTVLAFACVVVVVFGLLMTAIFYISYEEAAESGLVARAGLVASALNGSDEDHAAFLGGQIGDEVRYTLIASDGTVLYDSVVDASQLENHADRPEVQQALAQGSAHDTRYSDTLKTVTTYAAVLLSDGEVVRLAESHPSMFSFFGSMLAPMLGALALVVVLAFLMSRLLTRNIMRPIDALDFSEPLENDIYTEMNPLLERIDEQQKQLKQQNRDLAVAENMRREFSANVSHEMKTPLTVIAGYAELMKNGLVDPGDAQRFAGLIYDESQVMRALINDVLTISRLEEAGGAERFDTAVDLLATAHAVAARLSVPAADAGVAVNVSGKGAVVHGSDTLAEEMIYNLVENGIRYNREGGSVDVEVGDDEGRPWLRVADTGRGIPEEYRDKVFERFFRVEKSRSKETGGTGLGLAIVKHAVQYFGGTIELESEVGKGTAFVLRFPDARMQPRPRPKDEPTSK